MKITCTDGTRCGYTNTGWPEPCDMLRDDPRHTEHLSGFHDSIECHPFTPALDARSAGSGTRVERDGVTEAMQRNDFLHVLDLALASNGHPGLPVVAILRDIEAGGYTYRLSDRALALAARSAKENDHD